MTVIPLNDACLSTDVSEAVDTCDYTAQVISRGPVPCAYCWRVGLKLQISRFLKSNEFIAYRNREAHTVLYPCFVGGI